MLLSTAHFPPIQYLSKIIDLEEITIEARESYQKQSYRNRFRVSAANGPIDLIIPLLKGWSSGQKIKDVKLDYSNGWNKVHRKTILSAYKHSPFYEFYIDDLSHFWEKKWRYLFDINMETLICIFGFLGLDIKICESEDFLKPASDLDLRYLIHPKKFLELDPDFEVVEYTQNFSDRYDFIPNLSILDLLFQTGPDALSIIRRSKKIPLP